MDFINVSINHGIYHHRSHNQGMYVSAEWSSQPMYRHNILTLYLFDLCSRFVKVRKWRVLGGLSLNYRWGRSARCGYKYTATIVGRVAEQWGRQLSGWWGSRAGLSTGCVFCTIIMANGVGWLRNSVKCASRWPNAIHVHASVALQRLIIYTKTVVFIDMTTRDWDRKCLTICSLDMIQWHLTFYSIIVIISIFLNSNFMNFIMWSQLWISSYNANFIFMVA